LRPPMGPAAAAPRPLPRPRKPPDGLLYGSYLCFEQRQQQQQQQQQQQKHQQQERVRGHGLATTQS
jgi:hypothetical protein